MTPMSVLSSRVLTSCRNLLTRGFGNDNKETCYNNINTIQKLKYTTQSMSDEIREMQVHIEEAEFVTYDFEMSGIGIVDRSFGVTSTYSAYRQSATDYIPIQIGIVAAKRTSDNHWIFRPSTHLIAPNVHRPFKSTLSTLKFLRNFNFDFNHWIDNATTLITLEEQISAELSVNKKIEEIEKELGKCELSQSMQETQIRSELPDDNDNQFAESIRIKISDWIKSDIQQMKLQINDPTKRLLARSILDVEFPHFVVDWDKQKTELTLFRSKSDCYRQKLLNLQREREKVLHNIGVRNLSDAISNSGVLLVGHSHFLDLLYLLSFSHELPISVPELTSSIKTHFPNFVDTKYLYESLVGELYSTEKETLESLCKTLYQKSTNVPFTFSIEGNEKSLYENLESSLKSSCSSSKSAVGCHHAGYDAVLTAYLFVAELSFLLKRNKKRWDSLNFTKPSKELKRTKKIIGITDLLGHFHNTVKVVNATPPTFKII